MANSSSDDLDVKHAQIIFKKTENVSKEASEILSHFELKTDEDKICLLTVANNFSWALENILSKFQRLAIDNLKKGDDNKDLKEAIQTFSTFIFSIQKNFEGDLDNLKKEIKTVLDNVVSKLTPLLIIVEHHSEYTNKQVFVVILGQLLSAVDKVKLRLKWERLTNEELEKEILEVITPKVNPLDKMNLEDENLLSRIIRFTNQALDDSFAVVDELNIDADHFDDETRNVVDKLGKIIVDIGYPVSKVLRSENDLKYLIQFVKLSNLKVLSIHEMVEFLSRKDTHGYKNLLLNSIVNFISCFIRYLRDMEIYMEE